MYMNNAFYLKKIKISANNKNSVTQRQPLLTFLCDPEDFIHIFNLTFNYSFSLSQC